MRTKMFCITLTMAAVAFGAWGLLAQVDAQIPYKMWSQQTSISIRLSVEAPSLLAKAEDALFTITKSDVPNMTLSHEVHKQVQPGKSTYLYFPEDLGAIAQPGQYDWTCTVAGQVVAKGKFAFSSQTKRSDSAVAME